MILSLDLSLSNCGWALHSKDSKLMDSGSIIPDMKSDPLFRINYLTNKIKELFPRADILYVENIYYNSYGYGSAIDDLFMLARLSGSILNAWIDYKHTIPTLIMATESRKLIGIPSGSTKVQIQMFIAGLYNMATKTQLEKYNVEVLKAQTEFPVKRLIKPNKIDKKANDSFKRKFKKRMDELSKEFEKEIGLGNDRADAIVVGRAAVKKESLKQG